jgi:hypothetical protein
MRILRPLSLLATATAVRAHHECRIPFLDKIPFLAKKEYTPLVFFSVPKGLSPECDAMENCVQEIEQELDIHVERLDAARSPEALQILQLLGQMNPPVLYHRESKQVYHLRPPTGAAAATTEDGESVRAPSVKVDMNRVRALAKGRRLPVQRDVLTGQPMFIGAEAGMEQDDLYDQDLSPLQRKGKQAIKERSASQARR